MVALEHPDHDRPQGQVQSVRRAISVLEAVAAGMAGRHENGIVEISRRCGLPVSTVHRLLSTLVETGMVSQDPDTGQYRIGVRAFEIGNTFLEHTDLRAVARPILRELSELVQETVNLAVRDGPYAIYIDQIESARMLKMFSRPGARAPITCTGVGKVLLSGLSDAEVQRILANDPLPRLTPNTITDPAALRKHLEMIRARGYAIDNEELELGVRCVAAPIQNYHGDVIAAISVSGPSLRLSEDRLPELIEQVRASAIAIGKALGRRQPTGVTR